MLTEKQMGALARAARKLAMECVEGAAPRLGAHAGFMFDGSPCCSLGHIYSRAFGPHGASLYATIGTTPEETVLWESNDAAMEPDRPAAVVFPLLALADALEEASRASAAEPPRE